jgi:predicted secreted protein
LPFAGRDTAKEHSMSEDRRSKKMVAVINCVVHHNARAAGAARYPGMNDEVVEILRKHEAGVIQMPCPEITFMGLRRTTAPGLSIRDVLDTPDGRARCEALSVSVVDTIEEFRRNGYTVVAVLGGDVDSPGCAVPAPVSRDSRQMPESGLGVFTRALLNELHRRDIHIPIRGIRDSARETLDEDLEWLDSALAES